MRNTIATLLVFLCAPLLIAAAQNPSAPIAGIEPSPAIWLLSDEDTQIYMLGTTHVLPADYVWRSEALNEIIAEVDELVLETNDDDLWGDTEAVLAFQDMMMLETPIPLIDRVSPDRRNALRGILKDGLLGPDMLDEMQSWVAAMALSMMPMMQNGDVDFGEFGEPTGAESDLTEVFAAAGKPVLALETSEEQLGFLSSISADGQRAMLDNVVDALAGAEANAWPKGHDDLLANWTSGNVQGLVEECDLDMGGSGEMNEILLERRNAHWTVWVTERMQQPGNVLLAVGACHLVGPLSVQTMLEREGLTVTRIH